jgi:hypothetical protein
MKALFSRAGGGGQRLSPSQAPTRPSTQDLSSSDLLREVYDMLQKSGLR